MKPTQTITMLQPGKGAPEGHTVVSYAAGQTYTVPADLAEAFFEQGIAALAEDVQQQPVKAPKLTPEPVPAPTATKLPPTPPAPAVSKRRGKNRPN